MAFLLKYVSTARLLLFPFGVIPRPNDNGLEMYNYAHTTYIGTLKMIVYFFKILSHSVDGNIFNNCCLDDRFLIDDHSERLSIYMYNNRFEILIALLYH